jgi:hypothetical protein
MKNLVAAGILALSTGAASAATIDFGTNFGAATTNGQQITTFDFGGGLTGSLSVFNAGLGGAGEARIFDTNVSDSADPDLEGDFTNAQDSTDVRNFGSALIIQERVNKASAIPDDERAGGSITFTFDKAIDLLSLDYLDGEEGASVFANMSQIGGFGSGISGDNLFVTLGFGADAMGITQFRVDFLGSGAIGAFDVQLSAVPIPASLPLLLAGLGGLGYMGRRRRKTS